MKPSLTLLAALALLAASAHAAPPAQTDKGVLTDPSGMTLYVSDKDVAGPGESACNDDCAENWPPLAATAADKPSGDFSVIARDDGSQQGAYQGRPLYRWSRDQKPDDTTGDGFKNLWRVGRP